MQRVDDDGILEGLRLDRLLPRRDDAVIEQVDARDLVPGDLIVITEFDFYPTIISPRRAHHCLVICANNTETTVDIMYLVPGSGLSHLKYHIDPETMYVPFPVLARSEKEK